MATLPLWVVAAHILWRHDTYGEWLPNTYFAKKVGYFPAAGARYLGSFVLEYALWFTLGLGVLAAWKRRIGKPSSAAAIALLTIFGHVGWYCFVIGGDHFEYRVLSYLMPVLALSLTGAALRVTARTDVAAGLVVVGLGLGSVVPWTLWSASQTQEGWAPERVEHLVAEHLPWPLDLVLGSPFDDLQLWLHDRGIAMRHQQHKVFLEHMLALLPPRSAGKDAFLRIENPVVAASGVGVVGWVFEGAHILDWYGLNDWVVARTPPEEAFLEHMAHARRPPPGYFAAFKPILYVEPTGFRQEAREAPLTDDQIRSIEADWRTRIEPL